MIEIKEIEKLADLSRIRLTGEEKEQMRKDIVSILAYVDQLKQVSAEQISLAASNDVPANKASRAAVKPGVRNVLREDAEPHKSGLYTEDILANAPRRQGNYLKVKKIL